MALRRAATREQGSVFHEQRRWLVLLLLAISLTPLIAGKDANWDFYNYHLYAAHALLHGRLGQDFMAASAQSYLNPVVFLPAYWMIMADWHSVSVRLVLAAVHSLNVLVLWKICEHSLFSGAGNHRYHVLMAVLLGLSAPVFLGTIGTTFGDPTISIFVLCGLLLLCGGARDPARLSASLGLAGLCLGLAAGFKPTNVIYGVGGAGAVLVTLGAGPRVLKALVYFGIAAFAGWLAGGGWWAWMVYREFGNPFFPLLNNIFASPDFPAVRLTVERYLSGGILDGLVQLFRIADYHSWIYVEPNLPDLRPALVLIIAAIALAKFGWQKLRGSGGDRRADAPSRLLLWFFLFSGVLWMATSGNGRYAIPLLLLAGPVLLWLVVRCMPDGRRALLTAAAMLIAQNVHAWGTWNGAWGALPWSGTWVEISVPRQLRERPYLYFTVELQTDTFVVPFVHPESAFVSLLGQYPIPPEGPGADRVRRLMAQHAGSLRFMARQWKTDIRKILTDLDEMFSPWELRTDPSDCATIAIGKSWENQAPLFSCALQPGTRLSAEYVRTKDRLSAVFGRIEAACPLLFSPPGWRFDRQGGMWSRKYMNTDIKLYTANGRMFYSQLEYGPFDVSIGSVEDWEAGRGRMNCTRPPARWAIERLSGAG